MNLEQLHYFALAHKFRNYSIAASKVPMSPQGFAKALRKLENELDVVLFEHGPRGQKEPTKYADVLLRYTDQAESSFRALQNEISVLKAQENHSIRVGLAAGIRGVLGSGFVPRFENEHRGITLSIEEAMDYSCDELLRSGSVDLAFIKDPFPDDFVTTEIGVSRIFYWVNKKNKLSSKSSLSIRDLKAQKLGLPGNSYKITKTILDACKEAGVTLRDVYCDTEMYCLYQFVSENKGISFTTKYHNELDVFGQNNDIVCIPSEEFTLSVGLARLKSHVLTHDENLFYEYGISRYLQ